MDFAFQSKDDQVGVFLEVKFIRKKARHCCQVTKDVHKLSLLDAKDVSETKPPRDVFKYILFIGTKADVSARIQSFAKKLGANDLKKLPYTEDKRLVEQVKSAFSNTIRRSKGCDAWAFPGVGKDEWKYWAVLLKEKQWWKDVAKLKGKLSDDTKDEAKDDDLANMAGDTENETDD